ncbi:MAG: molybdopterin molybdotransferase MoeA [Solirubrobacteraceae bacterium]
MTLTELPDARAAILALAQPLPAERVALHEALARVLAEDVGAQEPLPSFDSSAMDGYAVRAADVAAASAEAPVRLRLVAESRAGAVAGVAVHPGEAITISTGAMLPEGADAVVRVEDTACADSGVDVRAAVPSGTDVRRAGEDVRAGETVLRRGSPLSPAALGVLASLGRATVACARSPRVALLCTGDELVEVGQRSRPGTVRDSNSHALRGLLRWCGAEVSRTMHAPDDADATRTLIAASAEDVDALLICGGMSVGAHDHVRSSLEALHARRVISGLALRPGKPMWFGTLRETLVFGLPGNPVSALVTFVLLVAPALWALQGAIRRDEELSAVIDFDYEKRRGRAHALRCRLVSEPDGWHAQLTGPQGSHILSSMLDADALAILGSGATSVHAGERLPIVLLGRVGGGLL